MKRLITLLLALCLSFGMVACSSNEAEPTSAPETTHSATTTAPNPETEPDPTETEATETTAAKETTSISLDAAAALVKSVLDDGFQNYKASYDETGFTAEISFDGAASICALANSGDSKSIEDWATMVDSLVSLSESVSKFFEASGFKDYTVSLNLMNDLNPDNLLIMTINGELIYEAAGTYK